MFEVTDVDQRAGRGCNDDVTGYNGKSRTITITITVKARRKRKMRRRKKA